ncbi:hypothetical protein Lesp02_48110 [Lentzea sp. NBRC 105346]|nr:hypothetical protein Lesp02_48110 [Lentzea sp. NBRC 105346]
MVVGLGGVVTATVVVVVVGAADEDDGFVVVVDDGAELELESDGSDVGVLTSETVILGDCLDIVTSTGAAPPASGDWGPTMVSTAARAAPMSAPMPRRPGPLIPPSTRIAYLVHSIGSSGSH